jgi:hypothetical protein
MRFVKRRRNPKYPRIWPLLYRVFASRVDLLGDRYTLRLFGFGLRRNSIVLQKCNTMDEWRGSLNYSTTACGMSWRRSRPT